VWEVDDTLTREEQAKALRAIISAKLGVPITSEQDVRRWLNKYQDIKERGYIG
jgi:hypothetical protein